MATIPYHPAYGPSGGPAPGLILLRAHVMRRWPGTRSMGIYNPRRKRGGSSWSLHAEGRAWDCGLRWDTPAERTMGNDIERFLIDHSEALQIQGVFWGNHRWQSNRGFWAVTDRLHYDHLHIERNRIGAADRRPIAQIIVPIERLRSMPGYVTHVSVPGTDHGILVLHQDGTVASFGDTTVLGSPSGLAAPAVDIIPTPTGKGYWILAADGGVFAYGDACFAGSYPGLPGSARQGVRAFVELLPFGSGRGYSLVADDGSVYQFAA